ncbi:MULTISPECIES: DUF3304 domain-containing protein [unclassified Paraburkholderia]|uniref:DUF3304 domain-containing protein n=1 Tax=unclassified Paraburkholderia TaxID=2615204 RepID=UPI002AAF219D|nr:MULTISPECIES: DUF3304 domain-containing protein [unclassified Paraburkholderia]
MIFGLIRKTASCFVMLTFALDVAGCSRAAESSSQANAQVAAPPGATGVDDTLDLKISALNYTDVPIGRFQVNDVGDGAVRARRNGGASGISCCVSLPAKWHPGVTVTVDWRDDVMFAKNPVAMARRIVQVEPYESFYDGFLWVLFMPGDRIKVYASRWAPGFAGFPEGLQRPDEACPGHFALLNSDPHCLTPEKRSQR